MTGILPLPYRSARLPPSSCPSWPVRPGARPLPARSHLDPNRVADSGIRPDGLPRRGRPFPDGRDGTLRRAERLWSATAGSPRGPEVASEPGQDLVNGAAQKRGQPPLPDQQLQKCTELTLLCRLVEKTLKGCRTASIRRQQLGDAAIEHRVGNALHALP